MSKKRRKAKKQTKRRKTNWLLIGMIIGGGVIGLFVLLFLALQEPERLTLEDHCIQNPGSCVVQGEANAPVTIVEVLDFGCSHCRDFYMETAPLIEAEYIESGQVRWLAYPFSLGAATLPAANASLCAHEQGAYFEFVEAMFAQFDQPDAREVKP